MPHSTRTSFIYALLDPVTDEVRYIGKTTNPSKRFNAHLHAINDTHVSHWIQGLLKADLKPDVIIIEEASIDVIDEREVFWIAEYKTRGARLTNITPGGDGYPVGWKMSDEARQKQSVVRRGRKFSDEHKQHLGESIKKFASEHPERLPKGDKSGRRKHPENYPKGKDSFFGSHPFQGEAHGRAKLTDEQVLEIRQLYSLGNTSWNELAAKYNVDKHTIGRVIRKEGWKHI